MESYIKSTQKFKDEVIEIVRLMPLKELLFIPDSMVESAIRGWLEIDEETGISPAQEEYKTYYRMMTTLPDEQVIMDINLYMFRVARKIVDTITLTMLDNKYYDTIFAHSDLSREDAEFFAEITNDVIDRMEDKISTDVILQKHMLRKSASELKKEFNERVEELLDDSNNTDSD